MQLSMQPVNSKELLSLNYKSVPMILKTGACQITFIHIGKTSVMTVGSLQNVANLDVMEICIDIEIIKEVENQKLLGVIID